MKFGITDSFQCSYLPEKKERLLVYVGNGNSNSAMDYETMLEAGFRRSGDQIYRPQCLGCDACHSLRLEVDKFTPSRSQKRVLKRNQDVVSRLSRYDKPKYYDLYQHYISERHRDGGMYPPTPEQYTHFIYNNWAQPVFMELTLNDKLIAVAVTDELPNSLSALYTFFDPDMDDRSLGILSILEQIKKTKELGKQYLYLGYQIDSCTKMNYKQNFLPNEQYINHSWICFQKKHN
ncbi:arginyltransferase [Paraneptunicella aestuarii]|uniref:arginyltransferase n=1 Tax=Paraneptunicella aestuarii TaxID=2831148 RepID=UPI001E3AC93B|nr:arginyltransferase [Paraneptunicella aestuarii]UAA40765.1 arginyltransferase [Paraneptunicella aestuarii]